ncbi:hypothetical protein GCG21_08810 [Pseudactinotalea sp. HY160]|uniref:hypothetical protein n=1 Tax=Pseudactinotalea sp. HY160 TaxID=2654490 RepID=UPI00128DACDE|nr:hypothetical protein [Pseudactinotalea sp. HY160]MPV50105.1 hypothetical protein [Pseudactinotalea sp. HY160]
MTATPRSVLRGIAATSIGLLLMAGCSAGVGETTSAPTAIETTSVAAVETTAARTPSPSPTQPVLNDVQLDSRVEILRNIDDDGYLGSATDAQLREGILHYCKTGTHKIPAGIPEGRLSTYEVVVQTVVGEDCTPVDELSPMRPLNAEDRRESVAGILYEAEGDGGMDLTMRTTTGTVQGSASQQLTDENGGIGIPAGNVASPYISVQNRANGGSVTCRIHRDGVLIAENTSHGKYSIVTCSP